jgi:hypothetical protein
MLTSRRTRPNVRGFAKVARDNRFLEGNRSSGPEGDYADKKGLGTHSMSRARWSSAIEHQANGLCSDSIYSIKRADWLREDDHPDPTKSTP